MRVNTMKEVQRANKMMRDALQDSSSSDSSESSSSLDAVREELVLTGIEHILTPSIIKKTKACRARRIRAVLDEQERQASSGIYDADRLALVSFQCSKSAARRAHKIGLMQSR